MLGIIVTNTGTADAPEEEAIRRYLRQFLADRHLINVPPVIWKPILELFILPNRPRKTLPRYQAFWTPEGSPFMITSREQCRILNEKLQGRLDKPYLVKLAMRYGNPSIESALQACMDAGCDRIVALPLYPQWTIPCAGTVLDEFDIQYKKVCGQNGPELIKILEYWEEPGYVEALADSIARVWTYKPGSKLIMTYHSIPISYITKGHDPYPHTTAETMRRVGERLGIPPEDQVLTYQSRFDSRKWLGPMLKNEAARLGAEGVTDVCAVSPIFATDCIETVWDIDTEARKAYTEAARELGIMNTKFTFVPSLGTDDAFMNVIANVVEKAARQGLCSVEVPDARHAAATR
ncbi:ferrochelatase [Slackia heliotrinireducens]|uniref:ferrochelatase n=1 Tax=Slackia heliotrinireducens TaxID=84110 RepID=UPI0033157E96